VNSGRSMYGEDLRTYVPVSTATHARLVEELRQTQLSTFDELFAQLLNGGSHRLVCGAKGTVRIGASIRTVSCRLRDPDHQRPHVWWSRSGVRRTF
jgi:hypothetical protein